MDEVVLCSLTLFLNRRERHSKGFMFFGPVDAQNRNKVTFSEKFLRHKAKLLGRKKQNGFRPFQLRCSIFSSIFL